MANILKGLLYKKTLDENGNINGKIPFLPKTLSNLVFRSNGKTVEKSLTDLENKKTHLVFDTMEEYTTAQEAGDIPEGMFCLVKNAE